MDKLSRTPKRTKVSKSTTKPQCKKPTTQRLIKSSKRSLTTKKSQLSLKPTLSQSSFQSTISLTQRTSQQFSFPKSTQRLFSTNPNPVQIPEVYAGDETLADGEEESRLPFSVKDAIKIKETLIDGIKASDNIKASLKHLGTASINSMLKQTQIENIVGEATLEVIQHLARQGVVNLPDIGSGTIAAQNFNTLYSLLQIQDASGKLKELADEQWCVLMELTFGTDQVVTRNVSISDKAAIKIATEYRNRVATTKFKNDINEAMMQHPIPQNGNPMMLKLAHELRQMEISNIVAPILEEIYGQYQFDGAEGFCLMKKAMEAHITNGEVVSILNEAQRHIIEASGLDQSAILEN